MEVLFTNIDGNHYAIDPVTRKDGSERLLSARCSGVTHILMITDPSVSDAGKVFDGKMKKALTDLVNRFGGRVADISNEELGVNGLQATFINFIKYQIGGQSYPVTDRMQRIFIYGAVCEDNKLTIYLPGEDGESLYYTDISLEMKYKRVPFMETYIENSGWKGKKETVRDSGYDFVKFERILGYADGMVSYDVVIKGRTYTIPVTEDMIGKVILIRRPFTVKGNKITLREVKER